MPAALMVAYPAGDGAHFDRDYYVATHLPLVRRAFASQGLTDVAGYFPDASGDLLAVAILTFTDAARRDSALASAEAAPVFADIANFTTASPIPMPMTVA
ncbi:EthD family reductase [Sphingomonas floccifaciens]|jgi:uncharacterized protein (TIGR02118 family)|uniref:EthD family reductase n=1 Tax=Sphingomonas floccifaciens TaxID=1844115 RepID=A0ABW4N9C7_9SPHN